MIALEVVGIPAPQGSKSAFVRGGRAVMVDGTSKKGRAAVSDWRSAVATAARDYIAANPMAPLDEPVAVSLVFRFSSTKSDPYRRLHAGKPDIDKLSRATLDSLKSGGLLRDDSLVYDLWARKYYALDGESVGCSVSIIPHGELEAFLRQTAKTSAAERRKAERATAKEVAS